MDRIKEFFNGLAEKWDDYQEATEERKTELLKKAGVKKGQLAIDIACGTGAITATLHAITGEKVLAVDISDKMIAVAEKKYRELPWATFINEDILSLKTEEKFDIAVIYNAYPHFFEVDKLCKKTAELLKDGGTLAIIHSLSRKELSSHHSAHAANVSHPILSPEEEGKKFTDRFTILTAEESDNHYLLVLKKRDRL